MVRDASSLHSNLLIERTSAPSYVLKRGVGPRGAAAVAHEAAVLQALATVPGLRGQLPTVVDRDDAAGRLVLERVGSGEDLRRHHARLGSFPPALGAAVGRALASLHRLPVGLHGDETVVAPWALRIDRPGLETMREASAAELQLIELVQRDPRLGERLREIEASWEATCTVHNDVKWDNLVVCGAGDEARVALIDWEMAGPGDPCWDVGAAIAVYLSAWLFSMPHASDASPSRMLEDAATPLAEVQPAMRACWRAYADATGVHGSARAQRALRVAELAAVRLLQTACEAGHASSVLSFGGAVHAQVSRNILERPADALVHIFGLSRAEALRET